MQDFVVYRYQERFHAKLRSGDKDATLRSSDKGAKSGMACAMMPADVDSKTTPISFGVIRSVSSILIFTSDAIAHEKPKTIVALSGKWLSGEAAADIAKRSGFDSVEAMAQWVAEHYKTKDWSGFLHTWLPCS